MRGPERRRRGLYLLLAITIWIAGLRPLFSCKLEASNVLRLKCWNVLGLEQLWWQQEMTWNPRCISAFGLTASAGRWWLLPLGVSWKGGEENKFSFCVAWLVYCLETEVFLRCQITDILSENKNKTQCIARLCFLSRLAQSRDDSKGAAGSSFQNKMKIMRLKFEHCAASEDQSSQGTIAKISQSQRSRLLVERAY